MKISINKIKKEELTKKGVFNWPIWTCEISEFPWTYSEKEFSYILDGEIEVKTLERMHRKHTGDLTSYENLLKGKRAHHKYKQESHTEAVNYFNKAIELDPDNGSAYAWKACAVGGGLLRGFF